VLRSLARPGDVVLTEHLSYPGLQALARLMRLQLVGLEMDEQGLLPDALDQAARNMGARILFCSPSLHNPTNATMSMQRRRQLAKVADKHHLLLIEDAVQAVIQASPLPALSTLRPDHSFLLASFSKVLGPGLRVGYIEAAPQWLSMFAASMRADCWMVAPLMPEIASRWLADGTVESLIAAQRQQIAARLKMAHRHLQGLELGSDPESALVWLPLPEPWRAGQFAAVLRQAGVQVRTSDHFAVGRSPAPHAVRISLNATHDLEQLERGLATLAATLHGAPLAQMDP
jgi:DNA-binding transcriptional MocR family regulator